MHQLLPVFSPGDAIGGATRLTRAMLHRLGFRSEIFAELIDQQLHSQARPAHELEAALRPGDAVMYHLSSGYPVARLMERVRALRIIVYHNITPARYYREASPDVTYRLEAGREDLRRLAPLADLCIAGSAYNLEDLLAAGARTHAIIPPPVDLERLSPRPATPQRPPIILFVGRVAPHKRHDDLIRALAVLRAEAEPDARLVLAGSSDDTTSYVAGLHALATALGVADAVDIPGTRLTDADLADHYAKASVFACASDHEGFCMPIIEAMAFSIPIVAHAAGAVPDTMDGAGVLLAEKDPLVWGAVIARLINDLALRAQLIGAGRRRLDDFRPPAIERQFATALASIGLTAGRS